MTIILTEYDPIARENYTKAELKNVEQVQIYKQIDNRIEIDYKLKDKEYNSFPDFDFYVCKLDIMIEIIEKE